MEEPAQEEEEEKRRIADRVGASSRVARGLLHGLEPMSIAARRSLCLSSGLRVASEETGE